MILSKEYIYFCQLLYEINQKAALKMLFYYPFHHENWSMSGNISSSITWVDTSEGHEYWKNLHFKLEE